MADKYVDINASGTDAGTSWTNAFDNMTSILAAFVAASPGDKFWIKGGTYTLTAAWDVATDGTEVLPNLLIGVKSATTNEPPVLSDHSFGTDRPLFVAGANSFSFDDYWKGYNIRGTSTNLFGFRIDLGARFYNCSWANTTGTANRRAFYLVGSTGGITSNCTAECTNGGGIELTASCAVHNCYIKDSVNGVIASNSVQILNSIVYNCTEAIKGTFSDYIRVLYNSIDNCTSGFTAGTTERPGMWVGNNISNCTDGLKLDFSGTLNLSYFMDYNNWFNNTRDISVDNGTSEDNSMKGLNATAVDPNFTASGADDFTLTSGSAMRNAGMPMLHGVG